MGSALATSTLEDLWFGDGTDEPAEKRAAESVAALVAKVHGVKPLPVAAQKLMRIARDPKVETAGIARVLETDPALGARVLRIVNSAVFALRTPCKSAQHAVALLGPMKISEIATASSIMDMFDDAGAESRFILEHALAVAGIMKRLAQRCELPVDDAFTCGLLHDLGKLMQLQAGPRGGAYAGLLEEEGKNCETFHLREREIYGFDHGVLAGCMLTQWKIPFPLPDAIALHHQTARAYRAGGVVAKMVHLLRIADKLSEIAPDARPTDEVLDALMNDESTSYLELQRDDFVSIWGEILRAIQASRRVLSTPDEPDPNAGDRESGVRRSAPPVDVQIRCVVCATVTHGATCPYCRGGICGSHTPGPGRACAKCEEEIAGLEKDSPWRFVSPAVLGITFVVAAIFGAVSAVLRSWQMSGAGVFAGAMIAVVVAAGIATMLRLRNNWSVRAKLAERRQRK